VKNVSFKLKENSILGLAGVAGNGQAELVEAILNWRKKESGKVIVRGLDMTNASIKTLRDQGIAYVPENRKKALVSELSLLENFMLNSYRDSGSFFNDVEAIVSETHHLIEKFNIKVPNPQVPVNTLSGGNKQKVVVAREFSQKAPNGHQIILIAENPTFGLDVGTTQFVREQILKLRSIGVSILLISNDLTEILTLSDEVKIMHKGEIKGSFSRSEATREKIALIMGGSLLDEDGA
jgi:simple sugar transport system ATP-binding protein